MKLKSLIFPATMITLVGLTLVSFICIGQTMQPDTNTAACRIVKAAERGNVAIMTELLASDPALIRTKEPGMEEPLLVVAARYNQPEIVALLLKKGSDVNATNRLGSNALHLASITGNYELVAMLMKSGADWKTRNMRGKTPVDYVPFGKNPDVFALFLEKDKNILSDKTGEGASLLHMAASAGDTAGFSWLLSKGLDAKAEDNNGANVVHWAMSAGNKTMLKYLDDHGLDYHLNSSRDYSPVMSAMMSKKLASVEFLLDNGVGIDDRFPPENFTLLQLACLSQAPDIAMFLAGRGAAVNAEESNGFTALFWTVMSQDPGLTLFMLDKGADVNHRTNDGQTPLLTAVDGDSLSMITLLADHGADLKAADGDGKTALHRASIRGTLPVVLYLLGKGVPVGLKDKKGMTALHYAAICGHPEIGKTLIERGADTGARDYASHNAAYYCAWYGNDELYKFLQQKGEKKAVMDAPVMALNNKLSKGQAVIHYLNHSGYAIETSKHLLIFDYFHNSPPPQSPSLLNGRIVPEELKGKQIIVFVSHEHDDHYDTAIWQWGSVNPGIRYVMGFKPDVRYSYDYAEPHHEKTIEGVRINVLKSTDSGAGFLVEADGIVVYHPGDHINKSGDLTAGFKDEIDYFVSLKKKVDISFFPVNGCGFPDKESVKVGNMYVVEKMKPGICISMHADVSECAGFSEEIARQYPGQKTGFGTFPGDRFEYHQN